MQSVGLFIWFKCFWALLIVHNPNQQISSCVASWWNLWARPPTLTRWCPTPNTEHRTPTRNLAMARRFHCPLLLQLLHVIHNVQHISGFFYDTLLHNCTVKILAKSIFLLNLHYQGKRGHRRPKAIWRVHINLPPVASCVSGHRAARQQRKT